MVCFLVVVLLLLVLHVQSFGFDSFLGGRGQNVPPNGKHHLTRLCGGSTFPKSEVERYKKSLKSFYQLRQVRLDRLLSDDDRFAAEVEKRILKRRAKLEEQIAKLTNFPWRDGDPHKAFAMEMCEQFKEALTDDEGTMFSIVHNWDKYQENDDVY